VHAQYYIAMKRSGGVTASAIAAILGSLLFLLLAAAFFLARASRVSQPGMPPLVRTGLLFCSLLMLVLFAGGITTGIGLLRLRPWSRISILVFSGLLAITFGLAAVMILVMPFPQTANAVAVTTAMRAGIAFFYGLFALLGAGWLYFFNRKEVRPQFSPRPSSRPLSISIIAGLFLFSGAGFLIFAILPLPATFLGLVVGGALGHLLYAVYGGTTLWAGTGLLRLKPLARMVAIGYGVFYGVNNLLFVALPGYLERVNALLAVMPVEVRLTQPRNYPQTMVFWLLIGALTYVVPIWFLVARRKAFLASNDAVARKLL
jgi:hypothetical protein